MKTQTYTETAQQAQHTPGPWRTYVRPGFMGQTCFAVLDEAGRVIAKTSLVSEPDDVALYEANARLIAAAPELLTELNLNEGLLLILRDEHKLFSPVFNEIVSTRLERTRAAIAKATSNT